MTKTELITTYAQDTDMTFILEEKAVYNEKGELVAGSTEVVGFYFGAPNEADTATFAHQGLKAEF